MIGLPVVLYNTYHFISGKRAVGVYQALKLLLRIHNQSSPSDKIASGRFHGPYQGQGGQNSETIKRKDNDPPMELLSRPRVRIAKERRIKRNEQRDQGKHGQGRSCDADSLTCGSCGCGCVRQREEDARLGRSRYTPPGATDRKKEK